MAQFSFDIVSEFDKGEMNNVFDQTQREIQSRYDFKGSSAALDWIDANKSGFKIIGDHKFHIDAIIDIIRKKAATREISQKTFDVSKEPTITNLKTTLLVPFVQGLDQDKAKKITALLREKLPKVKAQIQGDSVRVMSPKKDELQEAMQTIKQTELPFPLSFTNFR